MALRVIPFTQRATKNWKEKPDELAVFPDTSLKILFSLTCRSL